MSCWKSSLTASITAGTGTHRDTKKTPADIRWGSFDLAPIPAQSRPVLAMLDYVLGVHRGVHLRISKPAENG